jgi:hypothetical protein
MGFPLAWLGSRWAAWKALAWAAVAVPAVAAAGWAVGRHDGAAACQARYERQAREQGAAGHAKVVLDAQTAIARSQASGAAREVQRERIDARFRQLDRKAAHAAPDPVDACVLPAERLRDWNAANAGASADLGATAEQPDDAASNAASSSLGPDARPGGQPPGGGAPLSPAGQPALPPAAVAAAAR